MGKRKRGLIWLALLAALFLGRPILAEAGEATTGARREAVRLNGLCLTAEPASGSKILRALTSGTLVAVLERRGDWLLVETENGAKGFVYAGYLTGFEDVAVPAAYAGRLDPSVVSPAANAPARQLPSTEMAAPPPTPDAPQATLEFDWSPTPERQAEARRALDAYAEQARLELSGKARPTASVRSEQPDRTSENADGRRPGTGSKYLIEIRLAERRLSLFEKGPDGSKRLVKDYVVATPRGDVEAPAGWGVITEIDFDPGWRPTENMKRRAKAKGRTLPDYVKPGIRANPMGTFKAHLSHGFAFRIHGNNDPKSIGKAVTSGCIRMRNDEGLEMARMIDVGTEVIIF